MKPIKWNDKLSLNNPTIDTDHRFLLKIVNKFRSRVGQFKTSDEAMEILKALQFYAEKHFGREEELQRVAKYPYREAHHNDHINLIKKLDKLMDETKAASGDYLNNEVTPKIGLFLQDWLIGHVIESDLRMKPHVEKMQETSQTMDDLE